ncbi:MAG: hypothetical protein WC497_00810 [Patescibacteria group bacterium]
MNNKPKKLLWLGIIVFIILIGYIGIIVAHGFPDVSSGVTFAADETQWIRGLQQDAGMHFDHPLQQLLTYHFQVTEKTGDCFIVTGQTFYGIPLERAQMCNGSILTLPLAD